MAETEIRLLRTVRVFLFTDNFWIRTHDSIADLDELKKLRDDNLALNNVALTGEITENEDMLKGFTSLFTTKGYFPKAVFGGYIYKLKKRFCIRISGISYRKANWCKCCRSSFGWGICKD